MNFKRLKKIVIREILFDWIVASILMFLYSLLIDNIIFKIMSIISTILSKAIFDNYSAKFYKNE